MSKRKRLRASYAGLTEYRYGSAKKAIRLAPVWSGDKRTHRVSLVMDMLADWRLSPFEHEGSSRAGIRSALCLEGHGWDRADVTAADVVAEALRRMGARRPSWDQGQPEYTIGRDACIRCRGPIPPELSVGERSRGFCSAECARATMGQRRLRVMREATAAYQDAMDTIRRAEHDPVECASCGKTFRPLVPDGKFCSRACSAEAQKTRGHRTCMQCGKVFYPKRIVGKNAGLFCSVKCRSAHGFTTRFSKTCAICGTAFVAKLDSAACCSMPCTRLHYQFKVGKPPRRLTALVFDYVCRVAA